MGYKKSIFTCLFAILLITNVPFASAAPPENELNRYLAEIGWTKQELLDYLEYYEIPLDEFDSVEELKSVLGTPINSKNLQELLTKYNLSEKELNQLINQFGDSLAEYKFIEDLDTSLAFYTNHDNAMDDINSELAKLGITKQETQRLFEYLTQVEDNNKNQLNQMQSLDYRIEQFLETTDPTELSDEEINELADILKGTFELYEIQVKFKLNGKDISLNELLRLNKPGNLNTSIFSKSGELLMDFTIPVEFFEGVIAGWEELIHIGELANEFVDFLHDDKYNDIIQYK